MSHQLHCLTVMKLIRQRNTAFPRVSGGSYSELQSSHFYTILTSRCCSCEFTLIGNLKWSSWIWMFCTGLNKHLTRNGHYVNYIYIDFFIKEKSNLKYVSNSHKRQWNLLLVQKETQGSERSEFEKRRVKICFSWIHCWCFIGNP